MSEGVLLVLVGANLSVLAWILLETRATRILVAVHIAKQEELAKDVADHERRVRELEVAGGKPVWQGNPKRRR